MAQMRKASASYAFIECRATMRQEADVRRRNIPLNALRVFDAVARHRSLTRGAEELGITQSAASRQIAKLEHILGRPLLERAARGVRVNAAGATLSPPLSRMFEDLERSMRALAVTTTLTVHLPPALLNRRMMSVLSEFRSEHPTIDVQVVSTTTVGDRDRRADISVVFDRCMAEAPERTLLRRIAFLPMCSGKARPAANLSLSELLRSSDLLHVRVADERKDLLWSLYARQHDLDVDTSRGITFETITAAMEYASESRAIVLTDARLRHARGAGASLVAPFPDAAADLGFGYFMTFAPGVEEMSATRRLGEWLTRQLA